MQSVQFEGRKPTAADFTRSPRLQRYLAEPGKLDNVAEFRRWLGIFLIEHGRYKITPKGYDELAPERGMSKKSARAAVAEKMGTLIREGNASELFDRGYATRSSHVNWSERPIRLSVLGKFVEGFEDPKKIEWGDFCVSGLSCLLGSCYRNTPYLAFVDLGIAYSETEFLKHAETGFENGKFYPWEMETTPGNIFGKAENRVAAVRWLLWKTSKGPLEINMEDFEKNGLNDLINSKYHASIYAALVEAGFAYSSQEIIAQGDSRSFEGKKTYPWELRQTPDSFFDTLAHRVAAIEWIIWKTKKKAPSISTRDFTDNGLTGLIHKYRYSIYDAFVEANHAYSKEEIREHCRNGRFETEKSYPWELLQTPHGIYSEAETRRGVVHWLSSKLGKPIERLAYTDFKEHGVGGIYKTLRLSLLKEEAGSTTSDIPELEPKI
jgi:hypothetical protein